MFLFYFLMMIMIVALATWDIIVLWFIWKVCCHWFGKKRDSFKER